MTGKCLVFHSLVGALLSSFTCLIALCLIHSGCEVVVQVGVLVEQDSKHSLIFTILHQTRCNRCASTDMHKTELFLMLLASGIIVESDSFGHTSSCRSQHAAVRAMKGLPVDWRDLCDIAWQEKLK